MIRTLLFSVTLMACVSPCLAQAADVPKTNPQKLYMHYMPWFETPYSLGGNNWGWHWKMNTQNPNVILPNGQRQIASHYYPQIGPYDSHDPDVIEYHLLLMKLSGVDGVLIDWYGVQGTNGDINSLLTASNALIGKMDDFGMEFAVVMEDRFSTVSSQNQTPDINKAMANVAYLRDNYFNNPQYIRQGAGDDPLLLTFGPITFQQESQWTQILAQAGEDVSFLPLWYEKNDAGVNADGEYSWVYQDGNSYSSHLSNFYQFRAPGLDVAGGSAFPGFDDFYQEGGAGGGYFTIPHNDGETLATTLDLADTHSGVIDFLQLVTWNDFGEGTMFEPTVETGYDYLVQLQQYSGVTFGETDLELVHQLYLARKAFAGDAGAQASLDAVALLLAQLEVDDARAALLAVTDPSIIGDLDGDGFVGIADLNIVLSNWNQAVPPADGRADPSGDGFVGIEDLNVVLGNWNAGTPPAALVPEPASLGLMMASAALTLCRGLFRK